MNKKNVAVIGSGIAGLAIAVRLAVKGYNVHVYEKNAYPGGKLHAFEKKGYRFDAGPSLFTMPEYVLAILRLAGEDEHSFPYLKLENVCNYFYEDGKRFSAWADQERFIQQASETFQENPESIRKLKNKSEFIYNNTRHLFIENSLHEVKTYLTSGIVKSVLSLPFIGINKNMNAYYSSVLKSPHLIQFYNRYATYNGSNPYKAPATLHVIPHLEQSIGAYIPTKGMHQITTTLYELAIKKGVTFHFNETVERIVHDRKKVKGIALSGKTIDFDNVISNMDVYFTYHRLLKDLPAPERILNQPKSSSALIFYWGIKKTFSELDLHNIFFSKNYKEEFNYIFNKKELYEDPTVYINISSKFVEGDAPVNCENWFVMINTPENIGQDWENLIALSRKRIIEKISRLLNTPIEPLIEFEEVLDPRSIESKTGSHQGSLYGYSSNTTMAAFFRHPNKSGKLEGLYHCGGSVHPGGGIPLALMSAKIIDQYFE